MSLTRLISLTVVAVVAVSACNGGDVTSGTPLTIASVSPASGRLAGGDVVTITGTGFDAKPTVTFGGTTATSVTLTSPSTIDVVVPAHSAGPVAVVLRNARGQSATLENGYTYAPPPSIFSVAPREGRAAGGTPVTIFGIGFVAGATVSFGGQPASAVLVGGGGTSIFALTPAHGPGGVAIEVTNPDRQSVKIENRYAFIPSPIVTSVTPNTGSTAGGMSVVIAGTGFYDGMAVWFGNTPATDVTFVSSTRLLATVPPRPLGGAVNVQVGVPWESVDAELVNGFAYVAPAPVITDVTPRDGQWHGNTRVILTGTGFLPGATVSFGGITRPATVGDGGKSIMTFTPTHDPGVVTIMVTNPDRQSVQLTNWYTFNAYPDLRVTSVTPNAGTTGDSVVIYGAGFESPIAVSFGDVRAPTVTFVSSTQLIATVPPRAVTGTVDVKVFWPWDDGEALLVNGFTYVRPPAININRR